MKIQTKLRGHRRKRFSTAVETLIERAVEKEAKRWDVSRSFVIATALAFTFNIDVESYKNGRK